MILNNFQEIFEKNFEKFFGGVVVTKGQNFFFDFSPNQANSESILIFFRFFAKSIR